MTSRLQCLIFMWLDIQNDLKVVMAQIETGLHALHSEARTETVHSMDTDSTSTDLRPQKLPFAKVTIVDTGSPASNAVSYPSNYNNFIYTLISKVQLFSMVLTMFPKY